MAFFVPLIGTLIIFASPSFAAGGGGANSCAALFDASAAEVLTQNVSALTQLGYSSVVAKNMLTYAPAVAVQVIETKARPLLQTDINPNLKQSSLLYRGVALDRVEDYSPTLTTKNFDGMIYYGEPGYVKKFVVLAALANDRARRHQEARFAVVLEMQVPKLPELQKGFMDAGYYYERTLVSDDRAFLHRIGIMDFGATAAERARYYVESTYDLHKGVLTDGRLRAAPIHWLSPKAFFKKYALPPPK